MKKNNVLVIIPAHNEAENIATVLDDIKKHINFADVLVIDDCSSDNTRKIVKDCGIECISTIFNLRYAMAIQTGLKYARLHNYDYVIQMDADGQHLAEEAKKLYETIQDTNADIVIGSRYLKDTGYPCPFFRRIGTKLFSGMISLFCHTKIADPLTGFQCLNRRTIEYYADCGNYPEFPDAPLLIEMLMRGYKIVEVSTKMRLRENGESMHDGILKPIKYMTTQFYACIITVIKNAFRKELK